MPQMAYQHITDVDQAVDLLRYLQGNWAFCDAGIIGPNPSPLGMTYASFMLRDRVPVYQMSGALGADAFGMETVECNLAETVSLCLLMEKLPANWSGTICSDSKNAVNRGFGNATWNGVPEPWIQRTKQAAAKLGNICVIRLDGHPSPEQIVSGIGKGGAPCSVWNRYCDDLCKKEARKYARGRRS